jgi:OmpA-OmpF porin, OOP family
MTNGNRSWLASTVGIVGAVILLIGLCSSPALALDLHSLAGKAGGAARDKAVKEVNAKLLSEGRKNQCSFKSDSDQLAPGCDKKIKKLADQLIDARRQG